MEEILAARCAVDGQIIFIVGLHILSNKRGIRFLAELAPIQSVYKNVHSGVLLILIQQ